MTERRRGVRVGEQRILVEFEGDVWAFTPHGWWLFCNDAVANNGCVAPTTKYEAVLIGSIDHHPLDWTVSDYQRHLDERGTS